jgi:hypothetical protein
MTFAVALKSDWVFVQTANHVFLFLTFFLVGLALFLLARQTDILHLSDISDTSQGRLLVSTMCDFATAILLTLWKLKCSFWERDLSGFTKYKNRFKHRFETCVKKLCNKMTFQPSNVVLLVNKRLVNTNFLRNILFLRQG